MTIDERITRIELESEEYKALLEKRMPMLLEQERMVAVING